MIFDLWGTLVAPFDDDEHRRVMAAMAAAAGAEAEAFERGWIESYDERMRGGTIEEHIERVVGSTEVAEAARLRREHVRGLLRLRDDVGRTFAELRARGVKVGLISVCSSEVPEVVADFGLDFDVEVYSCSEEVAKPDPRVFALAAARLGVAPEACLFVDDHVENLAGAEQAGMNGVLIGEGEWPRRIGRVSDVLELL